MEINIAKQSQDLISSFNEVVGDDKSKVMVVMSTGIEKDGPKLLLACAGTGSMILNIQANAIVESFSHLIKSGVIKQPQIAVVDFLSNLNSELLEAASGVNHANK